MFWNRKKSTEKTLQETLDEARETVVRLMKNADKLTPEQQQELKSLMAAAGIASSSLRLAQTIKQADAFGDKMHDQTMKMIEEAHAMTVKSTLDPEKLAEAAKRIEASLAKENARIAEEKHQAAAKAAIEAARPIKVYKPLKLKSR